MAGQGNQSPLPQNTPHPTPSWPLQCEDTPEGDFDDDSDGAVAQASEEDEVQCHTWCRPHHQLASNMVVWGRMAWDGVRKPLAWETGFFWHGPGSSSAWYGQPSPFLGIHIYLNQSLVCACCRPGFWHSHATCFHVTAPHITCLTNLRMHNSQE